MLYRSKNAIQTEFALWLLFEISKFKPLKIFRFHYVIQLQNTNNLSSDYIAEKCQRCPQQWVLTINSGQIGS